MINGVLNVWKEAGFTSHDVVAKLRGILHQKKIGHTGTLDPDATGVLPVCLGKGTRLCDMLTDETKTYEALLHLGIATDTQDMSGTVTAEAPVTVTEEEVRDCIASFVGEQQQVPRQERKEQWPRTRPAGWPRRPLPRPRKYGPSELPYIS